MVPEVRFKGFIDDWEQHEMKNVLKKQYNGQTPSRSKSSFWNGTIDWLTSGELNRSIVTRTNEKITSNGQKNANLKIIPKGTFVIAITGLEAVGTRGNCALLGIDTTLNQSCMALFTDEKKLSPKFLFQWYRKYGNEYGIRYTQGTKQQSYNAEIINKLPINLPTLKEQKVINLLLSKVDIAITLQQQQLDLYTKLKKGLLQKLFPKDGEKIPRVRFADFHEDWEQRKLKDLANVIGGGTPSTKIGEYWNGDIDWYSPVEIGKSIFVNHSQKRITKLGLNKSSAKILPINTLLFTSRAGIGNTAILKKEGTTNQGFQSIVPIKDKLDIYYLYSNSDKLKRYGERVGGGSTFTEVSGKQMKEMPITIPTIHEQKNIGHIFQLLDFQIILQENNLKKLKQLKKFLLQKLFI